MGWSFWKVGWSSLGTIDVSYQWQAFPTAIVGDTLIRIRQEWNPTDFDKFAKKLLFGERFSDLGDSYRMAVYRKQDERVYQLEVRQEFKDRGFFARELLVKHSGYAVLLPGAWLVSVDIWQDEGAIGQLIDGGVYVGL